MDATRLVPLLPFLVVPDDGTCAGVLDALHEDVALRVAAIVLAHPDEPASGLDRLNDHIVDEPVLVADPHGDELGHVLCLVDLLEDVLELPVVFLHDSVCGEHGLLVMGLRPG